MPIRLDGRFCVVLDTGLPDRRVVMANTPGLFVQVDDGGAGFGAKLYATYRRLNYIYVDGADPSSARLADDHVHQSYWSTFVRRIEAIVAIVPAGDPAPLPALVAFNARTPPEPLQP